MKIQIPLLTLIFLGALSGVQSIQKPGFSINNHLKGIGVQTALSASKPPVLLGLYTSGFLSEQSVINKELRQVDEWAGKHSSIAGMFLDIEDSNPAYNIPVSLEILKQNGYTAFINLKSTRTAAEIARGDVDGKLRQIAQAYRTWLTKGQGRMAFIAPLQEMNIPGEKYSLDPENFKLAYQRIQQIFAQAGVPSNAVRWVFAPNGWSQQGHEFERYYPGSDRVDVIGFSSYNWGYCSHADWKEWKVNPAELFEPYITRIRKMAPRKPIFLAQTASASDTQSGSSSSAKDRWFQDAYTYLAAAPNVQAILYFNIDKECDWALYRNNGVSSDGYKEAIANPAFGYISPDDLAKMNLEQ